MCALDTPSQVQRDDRDAGSPDSEDDRGVLLYYKYVTLHATRGEDRRPEVARFFRELCSSQRQVGRVRVARDGINVTVGGRMEGLHKHIEAVVAHPLLAGRDIDYKLAPSTGALNEQARRESGFDQLCVSICKEVVSLGLERNGEDAPLEETAEHLSPREFHSRLQQAAARIAAAEAAEDGGGAARQHGFSGARDEASGSRGVVLLDARNVYETRIGGFRAPGVEFIDPQLRCFADLKGWMDANEARLRDRRVMMYCTGGVRCERASAYLRRKGRGFQDVVQLAGGIQRYLEEYSGGGFFVGKNFVFDERVAVGSGSPSVLGRCLACGSECDDYTPRARCSSCRMLVLLCPRCVSPAADGAAIGPAPAPLCELCWARQRSRRSPGGAGTPTGGRKLRVLCLHGFRQTGRQFRGRTAALRKKLRNVADFEFADGPHRLPRFVKPQPGLDELTEADRRSRPGAGQQDATEAAGSEAAGGKRAWLVSEEMQTFDRCAALAAGGAARAVPAPAFVQDRQLERQTLGWPEAVEQLREVLDQAADSFDGVMGFSQGAAVAAALCAMQQQGWMLRCSCCGRLRRPPLPQPQASCRWCACADTHAEPAPAAASGRLRFAWLCCGYPPPLPPQLQHSRLLEVPSLHVGCGPLDRQLAAQDSDTLLALFAPHTAVAVHNSRGHFIPATAACIAQYHNFLARFLPPQSEDSPCPQPPSHLEGPQKG